MDDSEPSWPQTTCNVTEFNSAPDHSAGIARTDVRDKEYYFELVVFKVGNTTFCVPKNGLVVPGTIFEAMFSLPMTGANAEGLNDENPINLPVNEEHFRGFLRAMYPFGEIQLGHTDWLGALDLSTMWMFDEMRMRAIQALEPWIKNQTAKEVVLLAKKYRILKWLKDGYTRLLQQSLTAAELSATPSLDWETIAKLLSAKLFTSSQRQYDVFSSTTGVHDLPSAALELEFNEEFSGMD